jgi:hypothetical protein
MSFEEFFFLLIFAIPTYFFWKWLYGKLIINPVRKRLAIWLSTIIITPLLYGGAIMLLIFYMCYYPKNDFDRKEWFANKQVRYRMSGSIIKSKMLVGKTKEQVRAILGEQEHVSNSDKWYYDLGLLPGFAMDSDHLYILFKNDKVVDAKQIHG